MCLHNDDVFRNGVGHFDHVTLSGPETDKQPRLSKYTVNCGGP